MSEDLTSSLVRFLPIFALFTLLFSPIAQCESPSNPRVLKQCNALRSALPERLVLPNATGYAESIDSYWSQQARSPRPACIVVPRSTAEVATAVRSITALNKNSRGKEVPFAIRGGGHTPWAGAANVDGGIVIDLSHFTDISIDKASKIVKVGAGQKWGAVYRAVEQEGLMVVGGRGSDIGVAGLITGGGVSFFSGTKGFACDNVVNFEVVLANGQIANVNAQEKPDLFRALKGGSNNFAVVTRFDLAAFESGPLLGGVILYADTATPSLLQAFTEAIESKDYDGNTALLASTAWVPSMGFIASMNLEYTASTETPAVFKPFLEAQPQFSNTVRASNMSDLAVEFVQHMQPGGRSLFVTSSWLSSGPFLSEIYANFKATACTLANVTGIVETVNFQTVHPSASASANAKGGNTMALSTLSTPLVFMLLKFDWADESDDEQVMKYMREFNAWVEERAKELGIWHPWVYLNYAAPWQDPIRGYGREGREFLVKTSRRYDPEGVFQRQVPGGFKLGI